MRAPVRRRNRKAFTIVEVMMAAVIMLAGVVGMMQVIVSGSEMIDVSRKQTMAAQIIHGEIDRMRLSSWTQLANGTTTILLADAASPNSSAARYTFAGYPEIWTTLTQSRFTCTRVVSDVRTDLKKIVFTVTWLGNTNRVTGGVNSRQYTRTGTTYFGKNGLYVTYQRS
jgi:Tfp pilus assembly protein PilV